MVCINDRVLAAESRTLVDSQNCQYLAPNERPKRQFTLRSQRMAGLPYAVSFHRRFLYISFHAVASLFGSTFPWERTTRRHRLHRARPSTPAPTSMEPDSAAVSTAVGQHLTELNPRSAAIGSWKVVIFNARTEQWVAKSGQQGGVYRCILVCQKDPTSYVEAKLLSRGADTKRVDTALNKYKDKLAFKITRVQLLTETKQQYLHCPVKLIVDLGKTKTDPMLANTKDLASLQPQPPMTLSDAKTLHQAQRFDITAIVSSVSDRPRDVGASRKVVDVHLLDNSGTDRKAFSVKMGVFHDDPPSKETRDMLDLLRTAGNDPVTCFAVQGKKTDDGYQLSTSKDFFAVKAVGPRAVDLAYQAEALKSMTGDECEVLPSTTLAERDYANEEGKETLSRIIEGLSAEIGVKDLASGSTPWQLNWVEVGWPESPDILPKDGRMIPSTARRPTV